ncbi:MULTISPECIES: outer membrane beta-barrel protein [Chromohalobacter]|uniref:OmpA-like transmembrane region n=1 Tax=Chromohalobacter israelensis (strain ATCC BAA-138 / DSM 3043 / CIP 106854 / NCIMB 13768 / 1H11) TaxID=290398 RepID=Q1QVU8_CHRI1|nr:MULTISPECIES: outer membrane beta-barrel protein [Chromohalobacter]ABE59410.1 OmpA-like transmembrane region [Chromohalobacter salexigens DSM 3043]MBZ5874822.1 outer membrane beta-barrel protein [Chromohalobacter salexigens]NQY46242.1 outer membrane beta-barrel protein [Chromohalobacter sp.]NWO56813.1 cell envelope biogenesis protein OmpA [Chromohalobacter salexigens]PWW36559.1 outer membrane protein with beta-barrel domain [Chromohalobacter salexigens]
MTIKTLLAASVATSTLFVFTPNAMAAPNPEGLYFGVGTGFSSLENDDDDIDDFIESGSEDFDVDDDDNTFKGFVGYNFNRYFATEAFYSDLGRVKLKGNGTANTDLESEAYGVSLVGKLPITQWFELFAKAGMAKWETDIDGNLGGASTDLEDNDGVDPVYGAGAQFNFKPFLVRAEYERYDFDSDYQIDSFTASVGWQF